MLLIYTKKYSGSLWGETLIFFGGIYLYSLGAGLGFEEIAISKGYVDFDEN